MTHFYASCIFNKVLKYSWQSSCYNNVLRPDLASLHYEQLHLPPPTASHSPFGPLLAPSPPERPGKQTALGHKGGNLLISVIIPIRWRIKVKVVGLMKGYG